MRREYCTYINVHYVTRALALHASLREHGGDFHLRAVCFDEITFRAVSYTHLTLPTIYSV